MGEKKTAVIPPARPGFRQSAVRWACWLGLVLLTACAPAVGQGSATATSTATPTRESPSSTATLTRTPVWTYAVTPFIHPATESSTPSGVYYAPGDNFLFKPPAGWILQQGSSRVYWQIDEMNHLLYYSAPLAGSAEAFCRLYTTKAITPKTKGKILEKGEFATRSGIAAHRIDYQYQILYKDKKEMISAAVFFFPADGRMLYFVYERFQNLHAETDTVVEESMNSVEWLFPDSEPTSKP